MVAKSLFTAAFLLSCTLAWGECPNGKCSSGECESAECKSGECAKGECCKEECSEGEYTKCSAEEDCSEGKCAKSECASGKCSKGECTKGECAKSECAASKCSKGECAKGECVKSECSKSQCSVAKCTRGESPDDCCAGEACALAKCAGEAYASLKCAIGACSTACSDGECSDSKCSVAENCKRGQCSEKRCSGKTCGDKTAAVAKKCSAGSCADGKCPTSKCATEACAEKCAKGRCTKSGCAIAACGDQRDTADLNEISAKIKRMQQLNQQIAELRQKLDLCRASIKPERMDVSITLVEIDRTKCRSLGIEFDFTNVSPFSEEVQGLVASLESHGLVRVLASKTQEVQNEESALIDIDASYRVAADGEVCQTKPYPAIAITPVSTGGDGVSVVIRPTSIEQGGAFGVDSQSSLAIPFRNSQFLTSFGRSIVSVSPMEESLHCWSEVGMDGSSELMSEIRETQHVAFIAVEPAGGEASQKAISQAAYEESLVSLVQEPECRTKAYPVPDLQVWKVRPGGVEFDAELLVNHIQSAVAPNSWRSEANPGADAAIEAFERNGSLVICQTKENHEAIAEMLNQLRRNHGEEEVSIGVPHSLSKAAGKCAASHEALKCSTTDNCTTEVKLAFGKRFMELPSAEVEEESYPIGECSTSFSVEPRCHDGHCTR